MDKFISEHPNLFKHFVTMKIISAVISLIVSIIAVILFVTILLPAVFTDMEQADARCESYQQYHQAITDRQTQAQENFDENTGRVQEIFSAVEAHKNTMESEKNQMHSDFQSNYDEAYDKVFGAQN